MRALEIPLPTVVDLLHCVHHSEVLNFCHWSNDNDHSVSQLPVHKALTYPYGQCEWALAPSLFGESFASCRNNLYTYSDLVPLEINWSCTCARKRDVVHSLCRVSLEHRLLLCWFVGSISSERKSSVSSSSFSSSSSASPSSWSWALVARVGCPSVVGLVVVVMLMGVVGRIGCLSLLLSISLSMDSHFKQSCAVVSQVMSLVRSLLSLLALSGCK